MTQLTNCKAVSHDMMQKCYCLDPNMALPQYTTVQCCFF